MGHYLLKDAPKTGTGDLLISVQAVEPIKLPSVTHELNIEFKRLLEMMIANCSDDIENGAVSKVRFVTASILTRQSPDFPKPGLCFIQIFL